MTPSSREWIPASLAATNARSRLFCLPFAGGGASAYRTWSRELPSHVQLVPVQLPGRENRLSEKSFTSTTTLVPELVAAMRPFLDRPFAIFGHSMGALLAFEATRALRRQSLPMPAHLFLSSHRAPQLPDLGTKVHRLEGQAFIDELRALGGTPEEVLAHEELMQIAGPILRADFQLCETYAYTPEPPLDVPLAVYGGSDDPTVTRAALEAWREQTTDAMTLRLFPGHHLYLQQARGELLQTLSAELRTLEHAGA